MENRILFFVNESVDPKTGIGKKILYQFDALKNLYGKVDFSYLSSIDNVYDARYYNNDRINSFKGRPLIRTFKVVTNFTSLYHKIIEHKISVLYIRYSHFGTPFFLLFLYRLHKKKINILLEIPTYPYDDEYKFSFSFKYLFYLIEQISRSYFKYYISNIITYSESDIIFGIKTVKLSNAVSLKDIPLVSIEPHITDRFMMIGVASLEFWHGYDRLIKALIEYYRSPQQIKVYFKIIGCKDGNKVVDELKNLVSKNNLENYVLFYGLTSGAELDNHFNTSHLAVGCLGVHRKGITSIKSLKNREYCARGLPFIYSEDDSDFDDKDYILKFPPDDSPLSISHIINFYNHLSPSINLYRHKMRGFIEKKLTWESQLSKVPFDFKK